MNRINPVILIVTLGAVQVLPAVAQDEPDQQSRRAAKSSVIEEVVVSATKRDQSVRDIPISIDAFNGDELMARGATNLEEVMKYSAGVTLQKGDRADNSSFTIRGIGGGNTFFFGRTYGVFVDDVSLVNPTLQGVVPQIDPFDMASVEVLKGPQGTLFGGAALAGAVRYVPAKPEFGAIYGSMSAGVGEMEDSDETRERHTLMTNIGGERVAFRFAASTDKTPGFIDDRRFEKDEDVNAGDVRTIRALIDWAPLDDLLLQVSFLRRQTVTEQLGYVDNLDGRRETRSKAADESGTSEVELPIFSATWSGVESFEIKLSLAQLDKKSLQNYDYTAFFEYQGTGNRARVDGYVSTADQPSAELRFVSKSFTESTWWILDGWQYLVGFYTQESEQLNTFDFIILERDPNSQDKQTDPNLLEPLPTLDPAKVNLPFIAYGVAEEEAVYFDLTKDLFDGRWQLGLGGRYYKQESLLDFYVDREVIGPTGSVTREDLGESHSRQSDEGFNPKVSLTWFWRDNVQFYTSAVKGYRFGGGNYLLDPLIVGEIPPTYDSDELWNYELGSRTEWFEGALKLDLTVFYIDWSNTQANLLSEGGVTQFNFVTNIGASEVEGAELEMQAALPWSFFLQLNASNSRAEVTEAFQAPRGFVEEGTRMPNSPSWTASAVLGHSAYWGEWTVNSSVSWAYQGEGKHDYVNPIILEAHSTYGASLVVSNESLPGRPEFSFIGTNITDVNEVLGTNTSGDTNVDSGNVKATVTTPRSLLASLRLHF